jgi:hypothetical protein
MAIYRIVSSLGLDWTENRREKNPFLLNDNQDVIQELFVFQIWRHCCVIGK